MPVREGAPRVLHVITGLDTGGAERSLVRLLAAAPELRDNATVVSLLGDGALVPDIRSLGVPLQSLNLRRGEITVGAIRTLRQLLRGSRPDVVLGWMYHGNIAASLTALGLRGAPPVLWGIRNALHGLDRERRSTRLVIRGGALLGWQPRCILYNSQRSRSQHERIGYPQARGMVIPNGFDTLRFRPDAVARLGIRRELGIKDDTPLLGVVARFDPLKDFSMLMAAAGQLAQSAPSARWVLAGPGVDRSNPAFAALLADETVKSRIYALGDRSDVERVMAALDVLVQPSLSEALPNAVGEAMACGVPCLVTDVGDSAILVGDTGRVVPARSSGELARAAAAMLALDPAMLRALGERARQRVASDYSANAMVTRYLDVIHRVIAPARPSH
jgi:glycosyltransferase involved in cell wall biosynthesis